MHKWMSTCSINVKTKAEMDAAYYRPRAIFYVRCVYFWPVVVSSSASCGHRTQSVRSVPRGASRRGLQAAVTSDDVDDDVDDRKD